MSMYSNTEPRRFGLDYATDDRVVFNFFNTVYAWMCVGLAVTATVAWLVAQNTQLVMTLNSRGVIVLMVLGLWAIAWGVHQAAHRISPMVATLLFLVYAALIGALLSYVFLIYDLATLGGAFIITAGTFGAMSLYGFVTKRDLSSIGSYLVMGAFGLIIASLVNVFIASTAFSWFLTYAILAVFIGLTAYHTQQLKTIAHQTAGSPQMAARYAIIGSLVLYVAFINMFMSILRILGSRK